MKKPGIPFEEARLRLLILTSPVVVPAVVLRSKLAACIEIIPLIHAIGVGVTLTAAWHRDYDDSGAIIAVSTTMGSPKSLLEHLVWANFLTMVLMLEALAIERIFRDVVLLPIIVMAAVPVLISIRIRRTGGKDAEDGYRQKHVLHVRHSLSEVI